MGEINIKCFFKEGLFTTRYEVKIFNFKNQLVCSGITNEFGFFKYIPHEYGVYKIVVKLLNCSFCFATKYTCCYFIGEKIVIPFIFSFPKNTSRHSVTIKLTDEYYKDLPIMEGKVILCNTQSQ